MTTSLKRLRGLKTLAQDAVIEGSKAIEKVQLQTAARPFSVVESIEPLAAPAKGVHVVHDAVVTATYGLVRFWTRAVGATLDVALDVAEAAQPDSPSEETHSKP